MTFPNYKITCKNIHDYEGNSRLTFSHYPADEQIVFVISTVLLNNIISSNIRFLKYCAILVKEYLKYCILGRLRTFESIHTGLMFFKKIQNNIHFYVNLYIYFNHIFFLFWWNNYTFCISYVTEITMILLLDTTLLSVRVRIAINNIFRLLIL